MPKIAVYKHLTFYIFAFDSLNEPEHLHIAKTKGKRQKSAKIWLKTLKIARKGTLTNKELNLAVQLIKENQTELIKSYRKTKEGKKIKTINLQLQ